MHSHKFGKKMVRKLKISSYKIAQVRPSLKFKMDPEYAKLTNHCRGLWFWKHSSLPTMVSFCAFLHYCVGHSSWIAKGDALSEENYVSEVLGVFITSNKDPMYKHLESNSD